MAGAGWWWWWRARSGATFRPPAPSSTPAGALTWRGEPLTWRGEILTWR